MEYDRQTWLTKKGKSECLFNLKVAGFSGLFSEHEKKKGQFTTSCG